MSSPIVPGPCPPSGCPAPTQIDCIEVTKVYDSCFQTETFNNLCTNIPSGPCCDIAAESGTTATCAVTASSCNLVGTTPTGVDDFVNATFAVSLTLTVTLTDPSGHTCTLTLPVNFLKTATLCGPAGTTQECVIASTSCGPCAIIGKSVCCQLTVCLVLKSVATVQLLVPSYGFCTPAPCTVQGLPPCPPGFPPNCTSGDCDDPSGAAGSGGEA
ncbi:MAG: hypothetical protein K6V73_00595 [Firmicutes bacterium]|nr:hypothetical protein [Bacillota bacterium]